MPKYFEQCNNTIDGVWGSVRQVEEARPEWMHACGCAILDIMMTPHNGDSIEDIFALSFTECVFVCRNIPGCAGWTG